MSSTYRSLGEVRDVVEKNYGLLTVSMGSLRDAFGAKALGKHVRKGIADGLLKLGLNYFPKWDDAEYEFLPPQYQNEWVRIYKIGSPAGDLINAVAYPTPENDNQLLQALAWIKVMK